MNNAGNSLNKIDWIENSLLYEYPGQKYLYENAINDAKEALKKQIPMKPTKIEHGYEAYHCKNCGACVGVWSVNHEQIVKSKYCPNCGQSQDWEGES